MMENPKSKESKEPLPSAILGAPSAAELMKDISNLTVEDLVVIYAYADAIVETVREPLIILGDDLSIRTANKAFFDTFKVTKEETYEKKIFDLGNGQWDIPKLKELLLDICDQTLEHRSLPRLFCRMRFLSHLDDQEPISFGRFQHFVNLRVDGKGL